MIGQMQIYFKSDSIKQYIETLHKILPMALLLAMACSFFLLDAVLPLQNLRFPNALLTHLGTWPLLPAHILFPRFPVVQNPIDKHVPGGVVIERSWKETALLFGVFSVIFLQYLLALRLLPKAINARYILISTMLLGGVCILVPVIISTDLYSYIAYARMGVI